MKPLPHEYSVQLTGKSSGYAMLSAANAPDLLAAPPVEFGGPGDAWSPEHLLLASVQACFLFTLRAVAQRSGLEFTGLHLDATGTVDRQDGVTRFTDIRLRVRLILPDGTDRDRVRLVLERSKNNCLISSSLSTPISLEVDLVEEVQPILA